jgi:hypothetical protein
MKSQVLEFKKVKKEKDSVDNRIKICLECGSEKTCINQYGVFCKNCGFLWDFEW